ncbi:hypothetical protein HDV05_007742, partial [Chytridiales sp. JEL 0842]
NYIPLLQSEVPLKTSLGHEPQVYARDTESMAKLKEAVAKTDKFASNAVYLAHIGFFTQMIKPLRITKETMVRGAAEFAASILGLEEPPRIPPRVAQMLGLQNVSGLRVGMSGATMKPRGYGERDEGRPFERRKFVDRDEGRSFERRRDDRDNDRFLKSRSDDNDGGFKRKYAVKGDAERKHGGNKPGVKKFWEGRGKTSPFIMYGAPYGTEITLEKTWSELEKGVDLILNRFEEGLNNANYINYYTLIYNYCTSSKMTTSYSDLSTGGPRGANLMGGEIYSNLKDYLKKHLVLLLSSASESEMTLLHYYTHQWTRFTRASTYIHHIFRYLNRNWVKREIDEGRKNVYDINTLALVSWREHLFMSVQADVVAAVLQLIEKQRNGESIEQSLIKSVVESFVSLGLDENDSTKPTLDIYKQYFEQAFIAATEAYYRSESEKFISENPVVGYMKKAAARLAEEENRIHLYLHASTHKPLVTTCENVLIKAHATAMQDEFQGLLDQDMMEDLDRMY